MANNIPVLSAGVRAPRTIGGMSETLLIGEQLLRRAFLEASVVSVEARTSFIQTGELHAPVCIIRRGIAYRSHELSNGRKAIIDILVPGDIAGLDHIHLTRAIGEFIAADLVSYQALGGAIIRKLMKDDRLSVRVVTLIAEAHWRVEWLATSLMRLDAIERIAAFILNIYQRLRWRGLTEGTTFNLPLTQEQLGDHLGLTSEHVNRSLRQLRMARLANIDQQVVTIRDLRRLFDLARQPGGFSSARRCRNPGRGPKLAF